MGQGTSAVQCHHGKDVHLPVIKAEDECRDSSGGLSTLDVHRKWLVYRLKQWGWLEVDLLLDA